MKTNNNNNKATMARHALHAIAGALIVVASGIMQSCSDWLDIKPNNEQVTPDYWKSKEDVEAVIASGYYYMRQSVPTLIKWGELRGGSIYTTTSSDAQLQNFDLTPSSKICEYDNIYKVINMANSVIKYAPGVMGEDNTYYDAMMKSNLCEAYFMRAWCYLILAKNYGEVPLVTEPYVDDSAPFDIAKSTETDILEQVKRDVKTALATEAAKPTYETEWQTKGRATKWALYALMTDACVWSEDYTTAIEYSDMILNAGDAFRPVFMTSTKDWYTMFYPGNSNESIFELNWDYNTNQETNNFSGMFQQSVGSEMRFTTRATELMREETAELKRLGFADDARMGRMLLGTYLPNSGNTQGWATATDYFLWKYAGTDVQDMVGGARAHQDANFIIYRVAEILLLKAQAETMKGNYLEALKLVDKIRRRAGLDNFNGIDPEGPDAADMAAQMDQVTLLEEIMKQKELEFMGEAKRWYDLLWLGRIEQNKYKELFVGKVMEGNETTNTAWIRSVMQNKNAWRMPLPQKDIEHNKLLVQNPYYQSSK